MTMPKGETGGESGHSVVMNGGQLWHFFLPWCWSGGVLDLLSNLNLTVCRGLALLVMAFTVLMFIAAPVLLLVGRKSPRFLKGLIILSITCLPFSGLAMWVLGDWLSGMHVWLEYLLWGAGYALMIAALILQSRSGLKPPLGAGPSARAISCIKGAPVRVGNAFLVRQASGVVLEQMMGEAPDVRSSR